MGWFTKKASGSRARLLEAVLVRNAAVRERVRAGVDGTRSAGLMLLAPVKRPGVRALAGGAREKRFELDELGAFVWNAIDGKGTMEELIRRFAGEKRVNLREAEVAVTAFVQTLVRRGLVALAIPKSATQL